MSCLPRTVVEGEEGADDDGDGGVVEEVEEGHLFEDRGPCFQIDVGGSMAGLNGWKEPVD